MFFELTLFATPTLQHLLLGACLFVVLASAIRLFHLSAELQSWLWASAFAICVGAPFATVASLAFFAEGIAPQPVLNEPAVQTEAVVQTTQPASSNPVQDSEIIPPHSTTNTALHWNLSAPWARKLADWWQGFLLFWLLGGAWRAVNLVRSIQRTRGLVESAAPYTNTDCRKYTGSCPILVSGDARVPMAAGFIQPVILLPKAFVEQFDTERLTPIILHEWAHIQRRDLWVGAFQELIAIVFWWSPVMRVLNRKIHISRELACDVRAAQALANGRQYAQSLVDCAKLMLTRRQNVLAMGLFSKRKELTKRVNNVLTIKNAKTPKRLATAAICSAFSIASLVAAQEFSPQVNLAFSHSQASVSSSLSRVEGERLITSIRNNDLPAVMEMLNSGLNINEPVLGEGTALIEAARRDNREMAEFLIKAGADVNQSSPGDGNPLIVAARHNHKELAELLYQQGADLDAVVPRDGTPLIAAIRSGHDALAEQLIEWGADVNQAAERDGNPLIAAAMTGNLKMAQQLYRTGADINGVVPSDETPLINASHQGHFDMVRFLVDNGADVNLGVMANDNEFRTPLNRARNSQIREYLISVGATE